MDTVIIVAVVLVSAGILVSLILWLRRPGPRTTEYVTVTELLARLQHEDEAADSDAGGPVTGRDAQQPTGDSTRHATTDGTETHVGGDTEQDTADSDRRATSDDTEQVTGSGAGRENRDSDREAADSDAENVRSAGPADSSADQHRDRDS